MEFSSLLFDTIYSVDRLAYLQLDQDWYWTHGYVETPAVGYIMTTEHGRGSHRGMDSLVLNLRFNMARAG